MAQDFAKRFYKSKAWQQCRRAYIFKVHGLCERCLSKGIYTPGVIVHHKVLLTASNINDPSVSLNHDHLLYVCLECHNREHMGDGATREDVMFDSNGDVVKRYAPR